MISPYDAKALRAILGVTENDQIPELVLRNYERVRGRIERMVPGAIPIPLLAFLALFDLRPLGDDELPPDPQGWRILVRRYNKNHEGRFIRVASEGMYEVALDNDPQGKELRIVPAANVTFVERVNDLPLPNPEGQPEESDG